MSDMTDKIKNSLRRHRDNVAIKKQLSIAKQHGMHNYNSDVVKQPHRMAKHHAMDCGNPGCMMCGNPRHHSKDSLTVQEKRFYQDTENVKNLSGNQLSDTYED